MFVHRLRKYLGAYLLQLADCRDVCIVFSGGIGENSAIIRSKTLQGLEVRRGRAITSLNKDLIEQYKSCFYLSMVSTGIVCCGHIQIYVCGQIPIYEDTFSTCRSSDHSPETMHADLCPCMMKYFRVESCPDFR